MNGRFNDENYDGIVLKIPSWFISINELEEPLSKFYEALINVNKSMYLPDHLNNLYEIDNRNTKTQIVKEKSDLIKKRNELLLQRHTDLLNKKVYELEWINKAWQLDNDIVRINDIEFTHSEYLTNKLYVRAAFINKIMPLLDTIDKVRNFALKNCYMLYNDLQFCNESFFDMGFTFYCTSTYNLGISYKRLYVKTNLTKSKKGFKYNPCKLLQFEDCLGIDNRGNLTDGERLEGFTISNMMLIKKDI